MSANGKSIITQEERGFIKVVAEEATGRILGAQMMCARATDMIGEFVTAITNGLTVKQMLKGIRVNTKQELEDRIYKYFDEVNADPIVYHWTYKLDEISPEDVS